jgi:protein-ribulosamine 3-kinase
MPMAKWEAVERAISEATGRAFRVRAERPVGGGCINAASLLEGEGGSYFVKHNRAERVAMFEAEAQGLRELAATRSVRVPDPVCWGAAGDSAYLVLEHLALGGRSGGAALARLGERLASLHRATAARYGWHMDNTIGSTPQRNAWSEDWATFWRERRLEYQFALAARNGYRGGLQRSGERLCAHASAFFTGYRPVPSLLHGDLWSGNQAVDAAGDPVIFDPAVYYGDRETDLAMTELFGGFGSSFYAAYQAAWPTDPGYATRKVLYNLYHVLNHLNLFGGGYLPQAERMVERLLAELG